MTALESLPAPVADVLKQCSGYAKTTPDGLLEAFKREAPGNLQEGPWAARHLLERSVYLALHLLGPAAIRASFKDSTFRRMTFNFMQVWDATASGHASPPQTSKDRAGAPVSESAFCRIAPAISGAASVVTAHALFDSLSRNNSELAWEAWDKYLAALARTEQQVDKQTAAMARATGMTLQEGEVVLAEANASLDNLADGVSGHGHLTLTNRALYFQGGSKSLLRPRAATQRMDLADNRRQDVHSQRVGPMGTRIFDRALTISSEEWPVPWVLDFLEYSGHRQRDTWQAMIGEVLAAHDFVREYSPPVDENEADCAPAAMVQKGASHATQMAVEGVNQLQACTSVLGTPPLHPERLLQFFWASKMAEGHLVEQALAVEVWGEGRPATGFMQSISSALRMSVSSGGSLASVGRVSSSGSVESAGSGASEGDSEALMEELDEALGEDITIVEENEEEEEGAGGEDGQSPIKGEDVKETRRRLRDRLRDRRQRAKEKVKRLVRGGNESSTGRLPAVGTTGAVFQKQWMDSPTWKTTESLSFWREKNDEGLWVGGPLVVGGRTKLEKALDVCRSQEKLAEKAQASIDGALVEGIPKNVDLLKELVLPVLIVLKFILVNAPSWENPAVTIATGLGLLFLVNSKYLWMVPSACLLGMVVLALFLRLTRRTAAAEPVVFFAKHTKNTVKKVIKLKELLDKIAAGLQAVNIALLKCRTLIFSDVPEETDKVLLAVVGLAVVLLVLAWIPMRLVATLIILHVFSKNMSFRKSHKKDHKSFSRQLKHWWETLPVAPVSVLALDEEVFEKEIKRVPIELRDKSAIIQRWGKDGSQASPSRKGAVEGPSMGGRALSAPASLPPRPYVPVVLPSDSSTPVYPHLDKDLSKSMKVVSSFIEESDLVEVV